LPVLHRISTWFLFKEDTVILSTGQGGNSINLNRQFVRGIQPDEAPLSFVGSIIGTAPADLSPFIKRVSRRLLGNGRGREN